MENLNAIGIDKTKAKHLATYSESHIYKQNMWRFILHFFTFFVASSFQKGNH